MLIHEKGARYRGDPGPRRKLSQDWACEDTDLDFLTDSRNRAITAKTGMRDRRQFRDQLNVCARCTTKEECLELALVYDEKIGIWGGTLPHERIK